MVYREVADRLDEVEYRSTLLQLARGARQMLKNSHSATDIVGSTSWNAASEEDAKVAGWARELISRLHPEDSVLIEGNDRIEGSNSVLWAVDPIDGSLNRIRDIPEYSFGACVIVGRQPALSVIWSGSLDITLCSWSRPAFRRVSASRLHPRVVGTGFSGSPDNAGRECSYLDQVLRKGHVVREYGSCLESVARVVTGRLDGYWERDLAVWDVAPAIPLLRLVGCDVRYGLDLGTFKRDCWIVAEAPGVELGLAEILGEGWSQSL